MELPAIDIPHSSTKHSPTNINTYKDTDNPHIHFAVNAYSYHPDAELLSDLKMEHISHYIFSELQRIFPNVNVRLAYSKEDW